MNEHNNNTEVNGILSTKYTFAFLAKIIFFLIFVLTFLIMISLFGKNPEGVPVTLFIVALLGFWPFILSVLATLNLSRSIKLLKRRGTNLPKVYEKIVKTNKTLVILTFIVIGLGFGLKKVVNFVNVHHKLSTLYKNNYKVLQNCTTWNEGGFYYDSVIFKLDDYEYPVVSKFDWADDEYNDNYNELKKADSFDYHNYIDYVFGVETISFMEIHEDEDYKLMDLDILLPESYLENKDSLKEKVRNVLKYYSYQFNSYNISFDIYYVNKIDLKNKYDYYLFMSSGTCTRNKKINNTIVEHMDFYINKERDIDKALSYKFG